MGIRRLQTTTSVPLFSRAVLILLAVTAAAASSSRSPLKRRDGRGRTDVAVRQPGSAQPRSGKGHERRSVFPVSPLHNSLCQLLCKRSAASIRRSCFLMRLERLMEPLIVRDPIRKALCWVLGKLLQYRREMEVLAHCIDSTSGKCTG